MSSLIKLLEDSLCLRMSRSLCVNIPLSKYQSVEWVLRSMLFVKAFKKIHTWMVSNYWLLQMVQEVSATLEYESFSKHWRSCPGTLYILYILHHATTADGTADGEMLWMQKESKTGNSFNTQNVGSLTFHISFPFQISQLLDILHITKLLAPPHRSPAPRPDPASLQKWYLPALAFLLLGTLQ